MTDKTKDVKQDKSSKESDEDTSKTKTDGQEEDVSKDVKTMMVLLSQRQFLMKDLRKLTTKRKSLRKS